MARLRSDRTGFGVDPPRRGGPLAQWSPSTPFNQGVSCRGLPRDQAVFLQEEIERLTLSGVLRPVEYSRWVSRAFLVPKPAGSGWRLIVDLREISKACHTRKMKMETLRSLRLIAKPGDHWVSFDLKDGFYSLAIAPQDREAFTVNLDVKLLQFCALPMGWCLIPLFSRSSRRCSRTTSGTRIRQPHLRGASESWFQRH